MKVSFGDVERWVSHAASSAVAVVEGLTHLGHIEDTPAAQKGAAVKFVEGIVHAKLEQYGAQELEKYVDALIDPKIEWALAEAKEGASHLHYGFGGLVADLIDSLD